MGWFDENGYDDGSGYARPAVEGQRPELGYVTNTGNTGFSGGTAVTGVPSPETPPQAPAAPQPSQVGHDGVYNGMTREQYRDAWMSSGVNSVQGMKDWLAKNGGEWLADNGTVRTPYGEVLDMGGNAKGSMAGNGVLRPAWGAPGGGGGVGVGVPPGAISVGSGASAGAMGGYGGYAGGGGHGLSHSFDPFVYEDFKAPDPFHAPSQDEAQNDPGYQFALKQAQQALTNQASKWGGLESGDFLKGMNDYTLGSAAQQYQQVYNRRASEYDRSYGNAFSANQANNQGRLGAFTANTNADLGYGNLDLGYTRAGNDFALGQGQLALGNKQADNSYALGMGNLGLGYYEAGNNYNLGLGNQQLGWANYGLNAQGQNFNQQYSLANLGLNAAGQVGQYGSTYGANAGGLITGAGNAQAGGYAGAGNAWGSALGNIGNMGMGYGLYRGMGGA